ncbi:MAG TPA: GNAT family N-acetyltransferase [Methanospirillum sp.]|nr:GNAT family N-acetyltransferase [Methanospirillum sp.]
MDTAQGFQDIQTGSIRVSQVRTARPVDMKNLYLAGDWWEEGWDEEYLSAVVHSGFAFVAAKDLDGTWVGMGRLISDGVSDAYLQDIVVLPEYRGKGVGTAIVTCLLEICKDHGIGWVGTIAGPEAAFFYRRFGFAKMNGYTPMRYEP